MKQRILRTVRALLHRILLPAWWDRVQRRRATALSGAQFLRVFAGAGSPDGTLRSFHVQSRYRFFFHPRNRKDFFLDTLTLTQPYESILAEADNVLHNRFQTLGSELVSLGDPIAWQRDFKSGKEWPLRPASELDILDLDQPSDVKVPWELSRFHQAWWLGKAYWLTRSERYAEKFRDLVEDWIEQNPPGAGVNWAVAMEAAIRACNWIAGYYFFCESRSLPPQFWTRFLKSLYVHGEFIWHHLEYARVNGNHFLSDIVGLIYLGIFFQDTPFGRKWLSWGVKNLEAEMRFQVEPDGVDFEKSTAYHRLVLELFMSAALLLRLNKRQLSPLFMQRLERMVEYVEAYVRPDGSIPLIGDADDGRLFRLSMQEDFNDHRHVLGVGAILFNRPDFAAAAAEFHQEVLWYFGGEGFERYRMLHGGTPPGSRAFMDGGYFVMRGPEVHVIVDAGEIGQRGRGGHGHNDTLGFEYWRRGSPVIVDSGTYAYTFDVQARQEFRSTRSHNTVMVDGKEIAEFAGLWKIVNDTTAPRVVRWQSDDETDLLEAEHHGYERLPSPVIHRRSITLKKRSGRLTIDDSCLGSGDHSLESYLHWYPGTTLTLQDARTAVASVGAERYIITASDGAWSLRQTWYSRRYGVREPKQTLVLSWTGRLPVSWRVVIEPLNHDKTENR